MNEIIIKCKDCGNNFDFSEGEQNFYKEKGFSSPVRCQECRKAKKQQKKEKERI